MTEIMNGKAKEKRVLIQLRTNHEDKRTLREYAKLSGMTVTDYIKHCTLEKPPRMKVATPEREVLLKLLSELGKVGSNINQIAKAMNTDLKTFQSIAIREELVAEALNGLNTLSSKVLEALNRKTEEDGHTGQDQG